MPERADRVQRRLRQPDDRRHELLQLRQRVREQVLQQRPVLDGYLRRDGLGVGVGQERRDDHGGDGRTAVDVNSSSAWRSAAGSCTRQIIRLSRPLSLASLRLASNKTLISVGNDATIQGGIQISNVNNVIIQNLNARTTSVNDDGIRITNAHHVWIDHVEVWDAARRQSRITRNYLI